MTEPIFEVELLSLNVDTREEMLNTADRLSVEIGLQAGRVHNIVGGDRTTGIRALDDARTVTDALGVVRSLSGYEQLDTTMAQAMNLTIGMSTRELELYKTVDRALARIGQPPLTDAEKASLHAKANEGYAAEVREPGSVDVDQCFKADTPIQMWPLDPSIKPRADGIYDGQLVLSKVWEKPISEIKVGDLVISYDDKGRLKPGPVTRTMQNQATHLLDFWNTGVTPGHAYYCADGKFKDQHVPLMDILRTDGAIMRADGTMIRAATNCEVGSMGDMMINASATLQKPDGTWTEPKPGKVRFGTRTILPDGTHMSFMEMAASEGWKVSSGDGCMIGMVKDENGTLREQKFLFPYTHGEELPKPEDYILARSDVTLEAIYAAGEWEQIGTRMPAPSEMVWLNTNYTGTLLQPSKPEPNIPPAFADHPDAPNCTMSETVFK